jgi:uncharacterized lipoprotein YddW (UPF0748 family)
MAITHLLKWTKFKGKTMTQAQVTASSLMLRDQPNLNGNVIDSLPAGTRVEIVKTDQGGNYPFGSEIRNDWQQITVGEQNGFVAGAYVTPVSSPPVFSNNKEIRGVWICSHYNSDVLKSSTSITNALDFLQLYGFNTLFPAVWNQGYTAFPSEVMERNGFPKQDPEYKNFDPIKEIVEQGKRRGMAVVPWFEYGFAASPKLDGGHILQLKPKWSAIDSSKNKVRHGDLTWMNSLNLEVQQFMLDLVKEVIQKYDVDGIQGDDRFPAMPFNAGYDNETVSAYNIKYGTNPPINGKEPVWIKFRADKLTQYLETLYKEVKRVKPTCTVFMAPAVFPFSLENLMQDTNNWIKHELVDFLNPQIYRSSFIGYKSEVDKIKANFVASQRLKYVPGIAFTANKIDLTTNDIVQSVNYNRQNGLGGQSFFYYEGLTRNSNEIAVALFNQNGYNQIASLPSSIIIT